MRRRSRRSCLETSAGTVGLSLIGKSAFLDPRCAQMHFRPGDAEPPKNDKRILSRVCRRSLNVVLICPFPPGSLGTNRTRVRNARIDAGTVSA
jgi:hypothetical protein